MPIHKFKNIAFTSLVHEVRAQHALILLDGLPSDPKKKDSLMQELFERGHDVFFPRYEGTWESSGEFLHRSPSEPIIEFVNQLRAGLLIEPDQTYIAKKICLVGASFGGGVALSVSNNSNIDTVCVISPVISFKLVRGIETLEKHVRDSYGVEYRFDSSRWNQLIFDKLHCPQTEKIEKPHNVLIVAGTNDDQIRVDDLQQYAQKHGVICETYPRGHMSLSKLDKTLLDRIDIFLNEKK